MISLILIVLMHSDLCPVSGFPTLIFVITTALERIF